MKATIQNPAVPRLLQSLDTWDDVADELVEIDGAIVQEADLTNVKRLSVDASRLESVSVTGAVFDTLEITDSECNRLESAAVQAHKATMLRVHMTDCRLTGSEFAEAEFQDCVFKNVKFNDVGFRFASFKRVRFEGCILREADFSSAKLSHVVMTDCDLEGTNFTSANCRDFDVSAEDLTLVKGPLGLKGATISETQLMQLAPLLASELGFRVIG